MLQYIFIFAIVPFLLIINYVQIDLTNLTKIVKRDINNINYMNSNTLLKNEKLPLFSSFKNTEVEPGMTHIIKTLEQDFIQLEEKVNNEQDINKLYNLAVEESDRITYPLSFGWGIVSHLNSVKNNDELRKEYEKMQPEVIKISTKISQSKIIYNALKKLLNSNTLDHIKKRIVESSVQQMSHSGIGLDGKDKDEFNNIKLKLGDLSNKFSNNVLDSTKEFVLYMQFNEEMLELPKTALELYSAQAKDKYPESTPTQGPWKITLDMQSYIPIMQHHPSSALRKQLYKEFITRASSGDKNNIPVIEEILKSKHKLATVLGFNNYAELSLSNKMASTVEEIENLLNMLSEKSKPYAEKELQSVKDVKKHAELSSGQCLNDLELWDIPYWSERYKESYLQFKEEELKPYFPLESVLTGLFDLASNLFGINIEQVDVVKENINVWDESVKYFKIFDTDTKKQIATFFLDPFSRPSEKRAGAWMDSCVNRNKYLNHAPTAYLVCNGSPPIKNKDGTTTPSLMTFREVETLFHEFGHGLQHMLTRIEDNGAAGINNVEWDAVELPSQFMENWCYHKPTVLNFAKHYKTGKTIPDDLFTKLLKQRTFMTGGGMCRQIYFAMLDLYLYSKLKSNENIIDIQKRFSDKYLVKQIHEDDKFLCSFSHIFAGGYSAGYYSYKWAEIMSADAFGAFEEIENNGIPGSISKLGRKFRDTILSKGGSEHPADIFKQFRGRAPTPDALLRHSGIE
jgi:oligopeptidase A